MNTICVKVGCFGNDVVRASRGFTVWALDSLRGGFKASPDRPTIILNSNNFLHPNICIFVILTTVVVTKKLISVNSSIKFWFRISEKVQFKNVFIDVLKSGWGGGVGG